RRSGEMKRIRREPAESHDRDESRHTAVDGPKRRLGRGRAKLLVRPRHDRGNVVAPKRGEGRGDAAAQASRDEGQRPRLPITLGGAPGIDTRDENASAVLEVRAELLAARDEIALV